MKYSTTTTLVKPTMTICSKGIQHNFVFIFRSYILFSVIFRSSRHFLGILFKSKGKRKTNPGAGPKASRPSWLAASGACQAKRWGGGGGLTPRPSLRPEAACWPRRSVRGHRALRGRYGAGSEGSPVAYAWKGGRREYEGSARDASGKEKCDTAHRSGRASTRR
jgi:hypothetical protein